MSTEIKTNDTFGSIPKRWSDAIEMSERFAISSLVPPNFRGKPNDILLTIQMGAEIGLSPIRVCVRIRLLQENTCWNK